MKQKYTKAEIEIIEFDTEDVITKSPIGQDYHDDYNDGDPLIP